MRKHLGKLVYLACVAVIFWVVLHPMYGCASPFRGAVGVVGSVPPVLSVEAVNSLVHDAKDRAAHDAFAGFIRTISWAANLLALASIAALVASFWVPLIPRATAAKCFGLSVGLAFTVYGLTRWGSLVAGVLFWVVVAACIATGVVVAWPYVVALRNRALHHEGVALAKVDPRAGVALQVSAKPRKYREKAARKALLPVPVAAVAEVTT